jgi:hypothetical protein
VAILEDASTAGKTRRFIKRLIKRHQAPDQASSSA